MRHWVLLCLGWSLYAQVDVAGLVKRSSENTERNWRKAPDYVYAERDVIEKLDGSGKPKTHTIKTYEVMVIDGSTYNKVIGINQQRAENQKLARERLLRSNEAPAVRKIRIARYQKERQQDHLMMHEMIHAFNYRLAGEETVRGHSCWVLDATPKPGYVPINRDAKVLTGMKGKLWIDKQEAQWVKVEAEVVKPVSFYAVATVTPGTRFELEQQPVGDGIWLPAHFAVRVNSTVLGIFSHNSLDDETYSNYRRAVSETVNLSK